MLRSLQGRRKDEGFSLASCPESIIYLCCGGQPKFSIERSVLHVSRRDERLCKVCSMLCAIILQAEDEINIFGRMKSKSKSKCLVYLNSDRKDALLRLPRPTPGATRGSAPRNVANWERTKSQQTKSNNCYEFS